MDKFGVQVFNADRPAQQVRLIFPRTRTQFGNVEAEVIPGGVVVASSEIWLWLARPLDTGSRADVVVEYQGEPPGDPVVELHDSPSVLHSDWDPRYLAAADGVLTQWKHTAISNARERHDREQKYREGLVSLHLESAPQWIEAQALAYFWAMEKAANRDLLPDGAVRQAVLDAEAALRGSLLRRVNPAAAAPCVDKRVLKSLSDLQLQLIVDFFVEGTRPTVDALDCSRINVSQFEEAYLLFASGGLWKDRSPLYASRPDSAYYFLFAEFAISAIDANIHPMVWRTLLPVLVWSQRTYTTVFEPYCPTPGGWVTADRGLLTFKTYRPREPWRDRAPAAVAELTRLLRSGSREFDCLKRMHATNACMAFPAGDGPALRLCPDSQPSNREM